MKTSVPLYHKLKNDLIRDLQSNKWEPGEMIPSEAELAKQHDVSRTTVRLAVGDLVSLGYLVRRQGKGTFVAEGKPSSVNTRLMGFAEELRTRGVEVSLRLKSLGLASCPDQVADQLHIARGSEVVKLSRIALEQDLPIFRETSYLLLPANASVDELSNHSNFHNHIYAFYEQFGVKIGFGSQTISAAQANHDDVQHLQMKLSEPILVICRLTSDDTGTPIEFSEVRYPSSRYEYEVKLSRGEGYIL